MLNMPIANAAGLSEGENPPLTFSTRIQTSTDEACRARTHDSRGAHNPQEDSKHSCRDHMIMRGCIRVSSE
jgi:hypothetical protein